MSTPGPAAAGERSLRGDAARNQERIVTAAAEAFRLGAEVTLEEVARRAGVGVATVYRRFRNRGELVRAVVAHVLAAEIEPVAVTETDDPWRDLAATLEATVAAVAAHRDLLALARAVGGIEVTTVDRYLGHLARVLSRARAAGLVRPELEPRDLAVAVVMVLATVKREGGVEVPGWRRYLALLLDGMRPAPVPLPGAAPDGCIADPRVADPRVADSRVTAAAAPPPSSPPASGR